MCITIYLVDALPLSACRISEDRLAHKLGQKPVIRDSVAKHVVDGLGVRVSSVDPLWFKRRFL